MTCAQLCSDVLCGGTNVTKSKGVWSWNSPVQKNKIILEEAVADIVLVQQTIATRYDLC